MFEFVNDPQFDLLPLVGADWHAAVAVRTECGRAARWLPGGDVMALAQFLGETYVVVGDGLYRKESSGNLAPVDLRTPFFAVVPPAGEPEMYHPDAFVSRWAQVIHVGPPTWPLPPVEPALGKALGVIAERDATIEALRTEIVSLHAARSETAPAPAKPAAKKAAASTKEKSDGDKSGA